MLMQSAALILALIKANVPVDCGVGLFDLQRDVLQSEDPFKALVCGRRGGKTTMDSNLLLDAAERNPVTGPDESITAYVGPTKNQAKRLMWGRLQTVAHRLKIQVETNATDLIVTHRNGAQMWIMGADDNRDIDRLRGFAYRRVVIDEAQAVGADFDELVDDVLEPALADYNGDLILTGTPNASCVGYFHDATNGLLTDEDGNDQWKTWSWTVLDNPMFPIWRGLDNWREIASNWLAEKRRKKGWSEDHPTYQREWLGRWVRDVDALVYHYDPTRNGWDGTLPTGRDWRYVLGVDLGQRDAFAMVLWAFADDTPDLYCVREFKRSGLSVSDWARLIGEWKDAYKPRAIVADQGGLGKAIVEDLNTRYGLGIEPAEKKQKYAAIEGLNSDMGSARVFIPPRSELARQMGTVQWDDKRKQEDPRYPNDVTDAALYGYREALHWAWKPEEHLPPAGTEGHAKIIEERLKAERLKEQRKQARKRWGRR